MDDHEEPEKIRRHFSYRRAAKDAETFRNDPEKITDLVVRAREKAASNMPESFREIQESVSALFRMLSAYAKGEYSAIPWGSICLVIGSLLYFLAPIDLIPDFIPILGLSDDAALLGWTISQIKADLDRFREWEANREISAEEPS